MVNCLYPSSKPSSGSGWESNPPRPATRPATSFEDQETHRDLTTPINKDNRGNGDSQVEDDSQLKKDRPIKFENFGEREEFGTDQA